MMLSDNGKNRTLGLSELIILTICGTKERINSGKMK
jgi:hypothetical protein